MTVNEAITQHRSDIDGTGAVIDRIVDGVIGRTLGQVDASTIFGAATTQGERTVIPVGRVASRHGFGGGAGQSGDDDGGGGGGGTLEVKPIGFIEISPDGSRFVPITDSSAIAIRAVTLAGIVATLFVLGLFRTIRARQ